MRRSLQLASLLFPVLLWAGIQPATAAPGSTLEQRLQRVERRVARITDLTLALDALREENRRLRGQIESLQHQIGQLRRKQRDIYLDMDQRLSALQQGPAPAAPVAAAGQGGSAAGAGPAPEPAMASATAGPGTGTGGQADPARAQADYKAAYALLDPQVRRYADAASAFEQFLKKYPDSPLAANARYWLGESYYVAQDNEHALAAFEQLLREHPDSAKAPGALYKIGRIRAARGERDEARAAFEQVVKQYPTAPAAGLARAQLQRLGQGH